MRPPWALDTPESSAISRCTALWVGGVADPVASHAPTPSGSAAEARGLTFGAPVVVQRG